MATDSTVKDLDDQFRGSRQVRRPHESQWLLNLAFFLGFQWLAVDQSGRLYEPELEDWRVKLVDNRIQPAVLTAVARMTKQQPVFVAAPATSDDEDMRAALLAEQLFEFEWDELDLTRKLRSALMWSRIASAGFLKVTWDATLGDSVDVYAGGDGKPLYDTEGRPMSTNRADITELLGAMPEEVQQGIQTRRIGMGDVRVDLRTPFEIYPDELADETGTESCEWIGEESIYRPSELKARFPEHADLFIADAYANPGVGESHLPGIPQMRQRSGTKTGVRVRELWAKHGSEHARGKHVVWLPGKKTLLEVDNPVKWLPYVMFRGTPAPGRFWPDAPVTQGISQQTELNTRISQVAENAGRIGNPPLMSPEGVEFEWEGLSGEHLKYPPLGTPDAVPRFLQLPELPSYVRDLDPMYRSLEEVFGQHEVTRGTVPAGVTAASAINLLLEQDDTRLGPDIGDMEVGLAHLGSRVVELLGRFCKIEKLVRIAGEDGDWDIFEIRPSLGLRSHYTLRVQAGSGMPRSKAAKQAAMQSLLDLVLRYGVQVDQRSLRKFFRDYEVGGLERMFDDLTEDERQANRENRQLLAGGEPEVNHRDNHLFHITAHNDLRKSSRWERAVHTNPQLAEVLEAHLEAHEQELMPSPAAPTTPDGSPEMPPGSPQLAQPGALSESTPPAALPFRQPAQ